jgi:hypothetical protein
MTRTFGPDNAIAWVQLRLRGGPRNLLSTTATYAAVIGVVMVGTVHLIPGPPGAALAAWGTGLLVIQAAVLLLFGSSRVASAIRQDLNSGIIESNRLMPVAPSQAVLGYILGSTSQALCVAAANVGLGLIACVASGTRAPDRFLLANGLLLAVAAFFWVVIACFALHTRNLVGLLFLLPAAVIFGQGGVLGLLPGLALFATPLLGSSVFDPSAALMAMTNAFALSIATQVVFGALFFAAAARKYRRADVIGFTPLLGLLLLAAWAGASWVGIGYWDTLRPRIFRMNWVEAEGQVLASVIVAMLLALVPVWAAAEQYVEWLRRSLHGDPALDRRPVPNGAVVAAATLVILPMVLAGGLWLPPAGLCVVAIVVPLHLVTASYLRRTLRFHTQQGTGLLIMFMGFLWVGPLLADLIRHEMLDHYNDPTLTEISCVSPLGALIAAFEGRTAQTTVGLLVQAGVAALAAILYRATHPARRARRLRGTVAA